MGRWLRSRNWWYGVLFVAALAGAFIAGSSRASTPASVQAQGQLRPAGPMRADGTVSTLLQYQGRLTNPTSGQIVPDGAYLMTFKLYEVPTGGAFLWAEVKEVTVTAGLFSTVLGDGTPLDQNLFDGRALWLGVKVGADAETSPRQQVLPVAYALSLVPGALVSGTNPGVLQARNTSSLAASAAISGVASAGYGVYGNSSGTGYGGYFTGAGGRALYAAGSITVSGNVNVGGSIKSATGTSLPVAYGYVWNNGSLNVGSPGVASQFDGFLQRYKINIGQPFSYGQFVVVVTLGAGCSYTAGTTEDNSNLVVSLTPPGGGSPGQCDFQFVVFKP
jgi:hypothetical protein